MLVEQVEHGFGPVADAFRTVANGSGPGGAALSVFLRGRQVVHLTTGSADAAGLRPYDAGTVQLIFSCSKGLGALLVNQLAQDGIVDLSAPVAQYWPEFAAQGKHAVTVDEILSHRAGLPCYDPALTLEQVCDGESAAAALAAQRPFWTTTHPHGYHAVTWGFLVAEIVRRATGRTLGELLHAAVQFIGYDDLWVGLPSSQLSRAAQLIPAATLTDADEISAMARFAPNTLAGRALSLNGVLRIAGRSFSYNKPELLSAELPAANAVTSANTLAAVYSATVVDTNGSRLLTDSATRAAREPLTEGIDQILGRPTRFGRGFMLPVDDVPMLSPTSFGHPGAGGSLAFADPETQVGFAYLTTRLGHRVLGDERPNALVEATRKALGL